MGDAFGVNAYDYLLKPVSQPVFDGVLRKAVNELLRIDETKEVVEEEQHKETEAERTRRLLHESWENDKINHVMVGYEVVKRQGELIERNIERFRNNQKTTRERLLEQVSNAASKWYTYGNCSKRYTLDE